MSSLSLERYGFISYVGEVFAVVDVTVLVKNVVIEVSDLVVVYSVDGSMNEVVAEFVIILDDVTVENEVLLVVISVIGVPEATFVFNVTIFVISVTLGDVTTLEEIVVFGVTDEDVVSVEV